MREVAAEGEIILRCGRIVTMSREVRRLRNRHTSRAMEGESRVVESTSRSANGDLFGCG